MVEQVSRQHQAKAGVAVLIPSPDRSLPGGLSLEIHQKVNRGITRDSRTERRKMPMKSPTAEAAAWSENMDTLLTNQEFSEENVEFWLACEDFKKTESAEKIASKAKMIYSEFIEADAPKEINIDFSTRDLISKNIAEPTLKCFDEAQKLIYSLMAKDSFPRFLKSEIYKKLVDSKQVGNNKKWLPFL
ncbi:Regulator of G-protein signaling 21 [Myotis davidii]|uniref:Regulator of G-protein signaling 21 n=1 Tax=Myotis davidii TaxID=225400 RepID=L5M1D0_MYODS|nr:Regulator of G-protein signaling 21 [Myotis davidii]